MAIRIVSDTGGNFSDSATWVGGVIPDYPDTIAFTLTSGNLNIDGGYSICGIDFSNYTGIFRMLSGDTFLEITAADVETAGFINMGTGGYTLIDDGSSDSGFIIGGDGFTLTNNFGIINPIKIGFQFPSLPEPFTINGNWLQEGIIRDGGVFINLIILNGTLTILGTQNFVYGIGFFCNANSTVLLNGNINVDYLQFDGGTVKLIGGTFIEINGAAFYSYNSDLSIDFNNYTFSTIFVDGIISNSIKLDSVLLSNIMMIEASGGQVNFSGSFGYIISNLEIYGIVTYKSGNEYIVNNNLKLQNAVLSSSILGVKSKFTLGQNINQELVLEVTATDIDSSGGIRVNNFYGTTANCDNWKVWTDNTLPQVTSTF